MLGEKTSILAGLGSVLLLCFVAASRGADDFDGKAKPPELEAPAPVIPTSAIKNSLNLAKHGLNLSQLANPKVMIIPIDDKETTYAGMIDEWQAGFVEHRLQRAEAEKFDLVILEIDTYGGEVPACERINQAIAHCKVPVIAFVKLKAFSGGALLSLGCKAIVMAPGSRIGGAKAIYMGVEMTPSERQKADSNMRAMVTGLCETNNHPAAIAVGMVNSESEIFETNDSKQRFVTAEMYEDMHPQPAKIGTLKGRGTILTLTAVEAVNYGLASGVVDEDDLFTALGWAPGHVNLDHADITAAEKVSRFLSHPIWRVLLVIAALIALYMEMHAPGHGVGYIFFALCLGMVFWLHLFADGASLVEMVLFAAGVMLIGAEVFLFPTVGVMLFAGFVFVLLSIILAFLSPSISLINVFTGKASPAELAIVNAGLKWASITTIAIVIGVITALANGARLPGLSRLTLRAASDSTAYPGGRNELKSEMRSITATGTPDLASLVGQTGTAETLLRPSGKVRLNGATVDAMSEASFIEPGTPIVVLRVASGSVVVRERDKA